MGSESSTNEQPPLQTSLKTAIPAVASSFVGVGVTASLVPLRVARLAVAGGANAIATPAEDSLAEPLKTSEESAVTDATTPETPESDALTLEARQADAREQEAEAC